MAQSIKNHLLNWALLFLIFFIQFANVFQQNALASDLLYDPHQIRGWVVYMHHDFNDQPETLHDDVLMVLQAKLFEIESRFPHDSLEHLKQVKIWVDVKHPQFPGAVYHPSAKWLNDHGYDERLAQSVHIANAKNFLDWSYQQPAMLIHEMAHAYHHQVLGYDHAGIKEAYQSAIDTGLYQSVLYISGGTQKAYALNNDQEFFAELTEAWFSCNDFYPFVRSEIKEYDPKTYELLQLIWKKH